MADTFLEFAKMAHYTKKVGSASSVDLIYFKLLTLPTQFQWIVDSAFAVFAVVFAISRLYFYPFYAIWCLIVIWIYNGACISLQVGPFVFFLLTLQALHIFWFKTIAQMVCWNITNMLFQQVPN